MEPRITKILNNNTFQRDETLMTNKFDTHEND